MEFPGNFKRLFQGFFGTIKDSIIYYENGQFYGNNKNDFIKPIIKKMIPGGTLKAIYSNPVLFKESLQHDIMNQTLNIYVEKGRWKHLLIKLKDHKVIRCTHSINYKPKDFVSHFDFNNRPIDQYINEFRLNQNSIIVEDEAVKLDFNNNEETLDVDDILNILSNSNTFAELLTIINLHNTANLVQGKLNLDSENIALLDTFLHNKGLKGSMDWNKHFVDKGLIINSEDLIINLENSVILSNAIDGFGYFS